MRISAQVMAANPELLELQHRIDAHVAGLERRLADTDAHGISAEGVARLRHTRDQARRHQARIALLVAQSGGERSERLVEGGTETR